ncbi:MAG TPA: Gfo/Idh/MocA family oxidoreductase [Tepidisphaeraceae bacterium]|jgi:predicted dehydrogenase
MNNPDISESPKLRFGIVGCGGVGPTHAGALLRIDDAQLVAVADLIPQRAQALADKVGGDIKVYASDQELVADPDIDVVCFATPSGLHAEHSIRALRAGKHVVVEKPMEVTLDACDRMIAAQRETGRKLTIISQHRFDPATRLVKEAIDSGKLGRIICATAEVKWWRKQDYYDVANWRGTWALDGGGSLMNQGVHTVDVLQWLVGGVESVFGHTATAAHQIETEDIACAALRFNCGAIGTLTAATAAFPGHPARIDIYGTEGSAIIEGDRLKQMVLKNGQTFTAEDAARDAISVAQGGTASVKDEAHRRAAFGDKKAGWGDAHRAQILDLIRAIREDGQPLLDGPAARKPVEVVLAIYQSARTQQLVQVADVAAATTHRAAPAVSVVVKPNVVVARRTAAAAAGSAAAVSRE